jgi:hypothetical protein
MALMCALLPIFGASALVVAAIGKLTSARIRSDLIRNDVTPVTLNQVRDASSCFSSVARPTFHEKVTLVPAVRPGR